MRPLPPIRINVIRLPDRKLMALTAQLYTYIFALNDISQIIHALRETAADRWSPQYGRYIILIGGNRAGLMADRVFQNLSDTPEDLSDAGRTYPFWVEHAEWLAEQFEREHDFIKGIRR